MRDSSSTARTVDTTYETQAPETVEITDDQPKIKRRRIKHDVLFKAELLQKKDDGMTTTDLLVTYKSFNLDKAKVSNWLKKKKTSLKLLLTFRKRSCSKSVLSSNFKLFTRNCMLSSQKLGLNNIM